MVYNLGNFMKLEIAADPLMQIWRSLCAAMYTHTMGRLISIIGAANWSVVGQT